MKRRIAAAAAALVIMITAASPAYASPTDMGVGIEVTAEAAYIVNEDTGRVVYQKNADRRMYPASTTKIMSAALAMSMCSDLEGTMVTTPYDLWSEFDGIDISNAGIYGGETMSMKDLIHCMLLPSANEAASAVAAYFGRDRFIEAMNRKAAELGCTGTHFTSPHGLHDDDHYTTARDLYRITQWAMTVPGFSEITCLSEYTLSETDDHYERDIYSTIMLQNSYSGYYTDYIRGIKTGTTDEAGRCLVTRAEKDGMTFTAVFLGCPMEIDTRFWEEGNSVFTNARMAFDWYFENTAVRDVLREGTPISETSLKYAAHKDYLMLYSAEPVSTLIQITADEDPVITYETQVPEEVEAPVTSGQVIGSAKVYSDGVYIADVDLVSREDIDKSYFLYIMYQINRMLTSRVAIVCYALLLLVAALYTYYMLVVVKKAEARNRSRVSQRNSRGNSRH